MNYVDRYLRLEEKAADAEDRVEQYRQRAEENRWEQCRIAADAAEDGYPRRDFAQAVGVSDTTIKRQLSVWRKYGSLATRPTYREAMAEAAAGTAAVDTETARKQIANAKAVLADPVLARQVVASSAVVRSVVNDALSEHRYEQPAPRSAPESTEQKFLNFTKASLDLRHNIGRLVEFANGARSSGHVKPSDLREIADEMRLYADALDAIADSRGLTDEALAEWIGEVA